MSLKPYRKKKFFLLISRIVVHIYIIRSKYLSSTTQNADMRWKVLFFSRHFPPNCVVDLENWDILNRLCLCCVLHSRALSHIPSYFIFFITSQTQHRGTLTSFKNERKENFFFGVGMWCSCFVLELRQNIYFRLFPTQPRKKGKMSERGSQNK